MFVYKYSQLKNRLKYSDIFRSDCKSNITKRFHIGQIKLLISELLFITKKYTGAKRVLYIGAAKGYHIAFLAQIFPELIFDLYDPREIITQKLPNINIYQKAFEEADQHLYLNMPGVLLISDIRNLVNLELKKSDIAKLDETIDADNELQKSWVQTIRPLAAHLKFRMRYAAGKTKYFAGPIYLQPYSPISTEARLVVTDYDNMIEYDNTEVDEKMAYFNCNIRSAYPGDTWLPILNKLGMRNVWDNNYMVFVCSLYMERIRGTKDTTKLIEFIEQMMSFLAKENPKKYPILYKKN